MKTNEVCALAARSQAPRFYIEVESAIHQYDIYKRTGKIPSGRPKNIEMLKEIFRRFEEMYSNYAGSAFKYSIMAQVLNSPAPSFYLEDNTAVNFYYRAMQQKRRGARR